MGKGEQQESDVAPSVVFHTPSGGDQHLIAELLTRNELQTINCESFDELAELTKYAVREGLTGLEA